MSDLIRPMPTPAPIDPTREYASGGHRGMVAQFARTLPAIADPSMAILGSDIYDRMRRDPQVSATIEIIKVSIVAHGWSITAAATPEDDPARGEIANEIADFVRYTLGMMTPPFADVLDTLLDAVADGNKIAEKVWEQTTWAGVPRLTIAKVKGKSAANVAFAVDPFMNIIGIMARTHGQPFPRLAGEVIGLDPDKPPPNLLPRAKFVIFTNQPRDSDPRGTSRLRPAYDWWWTKQQAIGEFLKYLAQFATPSLVGYTPADSSGGGMTFDLALVSPEQAMATTLLDYQNGTVAVFRGGSQVDVIHPQGGEDAFKTIFAMCDAQITVAVLLQTLATGTAAHQTQASTKEHANVLADLVSRIKGSLEAVVIRDMFRELVGYNWGAEYLDLVPSFSLGAVEQEDLTTLMTAIANLKRSGYLSDSQLAAIDALLNLPARLDDEPDEAMPPADTADETLPPLDEAADPESEDSDV